jgi:N-acetylneuraminate synthase/N,N'-diacetyllegionaminate synthase|tara:strand:+ start:11773 stop:12669 length:897 start_codon:yes stop_codon:yes gene_type:complete
MTENTEITIGSKVIGGNQPVFILAEIGLSHFGNIDTLKQLVDLVADAGADGIKLQSYSLENRVKYLTESGFFTETEEARICIEPHMLTSEQIKEIKEYAESKNLFFSSTPFDIETVDALDALDIDAFKIASFHTHDKNLIKKIAEKGKPVIMSTGVSELHFIDDAVKVLEEGGCKVILLHCMSSYPTDMENVNLINIQHLREKYPEHITGYSDHTIGNLIPVHAVGYGAKVIEVHLTLKHVPWPEGPHDDPFSKDATEFKELVKQIRDAEKARGVPRKGIYECEQRLVDYTKMFDKSE